jgi:hypothetical protein
MELIKADASGQLYFDFESLENLTSLEFVERVKRYFENDKIVKVHIDADSKCYMYFQFSFLYKGETPFVCEFRYDKISKSSEIEFCLTVDAMKRYAVWAEA